MVITGIKKRKQSGQSLIETIGAIFILTMGLTTALGLAVYAFSQSAVSQNEIIATNLAREGIDVVRFMRDSNWLADSVSSNSGYNLQSCADYGGSLCYPYAFCIEPDTNVYDIDPATLGRRLIFDSITGSWSFDPANTKDYNLYLQPDGSYTNTPRGASIFARMINLPTIPSGVTCNLNPSEVVVQSIVAWRGKGCTNFDTSQDLLALKTPCKIVTQEDLTNWKDYK